MYRFFAVDNQIFFDTDIVVYYISKRIKSIDENVFVLAAVNITTIHYSHKC